MQTIDIIILVLVGIFVLLGGLKGFIGQLSLVLSLIAGLLSWAFLSDFTAGLVSGWFENKWLVSGFAVFLSFFGGVLLVWLIMAFVKKTLNDSSLKKYDTVLGLLLGAFKGVALSAVIVVFVSEYGKPDLLEGAVIAPQVDKAGRWVGNKLDLEGLAYSYGEKAGEAVKDSVTKEDILSAIKSLGIDKKLLGGDSGAQPGVGGKQEGNSGQ